MVSAILYIFTFPRELAEFCDVNCEVIKENAAQHIHTNIILILKIKKVKYV